MFVGQYVGGLVVNDDLSQEAKKLHNVLIVAAITHL